MTRPRSWEEKETWMNMRKTLLLMASLALAACGGGGGGGGGTDSGPPRTDSGPPAGDSGAGETPTCATYCTTIMASCDDAADAQYASMANCMDTCAAFAV